MGLGRTPGRIIGSLMIHDPPYMTMKDLVRETSMSKASISTGLNMLTSIGFIEKFSLPGKRPDYYRIDNEFWRKAVMTKMTALQGFKRSIGNAIQLISEKPEDPHPTRTRTLNEMFAMYQFFEDKLPQLFDEWEAIREKEYSTNS